MSEENVELMDVVGNAIESAHPDVLRHLLSQVLHTLMDTETTRQCGAGYGERGVERTNSRNGYRERPLETRLGWIPLRIPKLRKGSYFPSFLQPRRRWEKAFVNVVAEAYVQGVSTRRVDELVEAMGATGMSKSEVSRMAKTLDEGVTTFRERPLEVAFPYVWLDALYVKVREEGRVCSRAVLIAIGVGEDGIRSVLGVQVARTEMVSSWTSFLSGLVNRGLRGVQLVISDAHEGLQRAIPAVLNGVTWQRCYVHFMRNVADAVGRKSSGIVMAALRNVFRQPTAELTRKAMGDAVGVLDEKFPKAAKLVRAAEEDVLAYLAFPEQHWRQVRSTNPLERLNKEVRRRVRVVGIFPNEAAVLRLVGALLQEQDEDWAVGRRYFSAASMAKLRSEEPQLLEESAHAAK
jgi:transposase-like protein